MGDSYGFENEPESNQRENHLPQIPKKGNRPNWKIELKNWKIKELLWNKIVNLYNWVTFSDTFSVKIFIMTYT